MKTKWQHQPDLSPERIISSRSAGSPDSQKLVRKNGRLWVTDLKRRKQWPSSPTESGHRRDFYRMSAPPLDPVGPEKAFSNMETAIAPVLRGLDVERRVPNADELDMLLTFVAIQWVRVPAFRPIILEIADSSYRSHLSEVLRSPESWAAALKHAGIPADSPDTDYDKMLEFERSGEYSLSVTNEWYVKKTFEAAESIIPSLEARRWGTLFSKKGNFIGSDNPVGLDGPKGQKIGLENAGIVTYPVSRHVLLYGTRSAVRPPSVNQMFIAHTNTFTMLTAYEQVYSHVADFCWLDETGAYQTDWQLFSTDKFP